MDILHGFSVLPILLKPNGSGLTSQSFCNLYVYPCLKQLQKNRDPFLHPFIGEGNSIANKFWGMHMYQHCGRTHQHFRPHYTFPVANKCQVYEHRCWHHKCSFKSVDVQYTKWSYSDCIIIILLYQDIHCLSFCPCGHALGWSGYLLYCFWTEEIFESHKTCLRPLTGSFVIWMTLCSHLEWP